MTSDRGERSTEALPPGSILAADFFVRASDEVGPDLIGKILWLRGVGGGRLTEVEAYLPEGDAASHAAHGLTRRNAAMFGPPGCIYLFRSYGIHICLNLVCDRKAVGSAVLVRSFEPLGDRSRLENNRSRVRRSPAATARRSVASATSGRWVSCGPGRVGQALGLGMELDGLSLGDRSGLYIIDDGEHPEVGRTTRVGISRGDSLTLRYYMRGSAYVSALRRTSGGDSR